MIFNRRMRGINLDHLKRSRLAATKDMSAPEYVVIPMKQHIGAPCEPTVQPGDHVYKGQVIGDSAVFVSAPIHSSVSGTVDSLCTILTPQNESVTCLKIKNDMKDELDPSIAPPVINGKEDFLAAVRTSGLVGLGGAGFPAHVKLAYKDIDKVKKLYINLAECEPYITTDNREVFENVYEIIDGIKLVLKWTGIPEAVVVVENNKPIGTQILLLHLSEIPEITVKVIGEKYPKGAEKVLVYEAGGPKIGRGQLPADCGVIVMNISSVSAIAHYLKTGIPLTRRRVTVDGDLISSPQNLYVPIGTTFSDVLQFVGVDRSKLNMLLAGGAMMGQCVIDIEYPVTKTTNAILCFSEFYDKDKSPCIHCGRCIRVCPIKLSPAVIERAYDRRDAAALKSANVDLCMNCGCCSYVCPAKRDLSHKNQLAKAFLRASESPKKVVK